MAKNDNQLTLFENKEWWDEHWQDMPEFNQNDCSPWHSMNVHFESRKDLEEFGKLLNININKNTKFTWYPPKEKVCRFKTMYVDDES